MITATDLLHHTDLSSTTAIVTGGYSGLGLETTRALSAAGATVIVPARRPDVAATALAGVPQVEIASLDLADLDSVREFAASVVDSGRPIQLLVNNAGIMAAPETRIGPGWESQFAINHLGPFTLTTQLWPALAAQGARVVTVGSGVSGIQWDDVQFERSYDKWTAYLQSKTANRLFALELDRRGAAHGVRSFSVAPGYILTPLQRHLALSEMVEAGWIDENGDQLDPSFRTPAQGAVPTLFAATATDLAGGQHIEWSDGDDSPVIAPLTDSVAGADASRLWDLSVELTGAGASVPAWVS